MRKHAATCALLFLLYAICLSSCASIDIRKSSSKAIDKLPQYWLTSSLYANPLEGPLAHMQSLSISPLGSSSEYIIPAGTLVQILSADRNQVYLKLARERGLVNIFNEHNYILKIPREVTTTMQLKKYLALLLSKKDPHEWILRTRAYIQEGIWKKQPVIGMNKRELLAAMGPAPKIHRQKNLSDQPQEIFYYADYLVILEQDSVSKVKKINYK